MAGKILDNGTLITFGLVGVVAAVGAANKAGLYGSRSHAKRTLLYHGTSTEELSGFLGGKTDEDGLYLTSNEGNASEYAEEKAAEVGGEPVMLIFDLDRLSGKLEPDWKWLPRDMQFRKVRWQDALDRTGHVVLKGDFSDAWINRDEVIA